MSAEAPKGIVENSLMHLGNSRRRFTGVLKRLFVNLPESGSSQQPVSKFIIPPQGLENFANEFQQGIDGHFETVRQGEIAKRVAEAVKVALKANEKVKDAERQREAREQENARKEDVAAEVLRILRALKIPEKLSYIQDNKWEGKGDIVSVESYDTSNIYEWNCMGGLSLEHSYAYYTQESEEWSSRGHRKYDYRWRYVPLTLNTCLSVAVMSLKPPGSDETKKALWIDSSTHGSTYEAFRAVVRIGEEDTGILLDTALTQETIHRISHKWLPSQLERKAWEELQKLPHWQKWQNVFRPPSIWISE